MKIHQKKGSHLLILGENRIFPEMSSNFSFSTFISPDKTFSMTSTFLPSNLMIPHKLKQHKFPNHSLCQDIAKKKHLSSMKIYHS